MSKMKGDMKVLFLGLYCFFLGSVIMVGLLFQGQMQYFSNWTVTGIFVGLLLVLCGIGFIFDYDTSTGKPLRRRLQRYIDERNTCLRAIADIEKKLKDEGL